MIAVAVVTAAVTAVVIDRIIVFFYFGMKHIKILTAIVFLLVGVTAAIAQDSSTKINKKNLVIKEWNTDARTNRKVLDHQTVYNSDGRKIEEKEYSTTGLKWTKRYEYGPDGKVSRELSYDERNKLVSIKKFEWNEFGRKKVQYTYDPKGKLVSTKVYEYLAEDSE